MPPRKPSGTGAGSTSGGGSGSRQLHTRVRTARGRPVGSTRWLQRQLNDPYVQQAKADGFRSRAAYKLRELDDRFHLLRPGMRVLDLGAAPGGWLQIAHARTLPDGMVAGVDLLEIDPLPGTALVQGDFTDPEIAAQLLALLDGRPDVVLSDMAPNTTGVASVDHLRIVALVEEAAAFACASLSIGGHFVAKVRQGGAEQDLLRRLKRAFTTVRHAKPKSSRADSAETYLVAMEFNGTDPFAEEHY